MARALLAILLLSLTSMGAQVTGVIVRPGPPAKPAQNSAPGVPPRPAAPEPKPLAPEMMPTKVPFEKTYGPFEIGLQGFVRQRYTVVEHGLKLVWPKGPNPHRDPEFDETVLGYEIRDAAGQVVFQKHASTSQDTRLSPYAGNFEGVTYLSASVVEGGRWRALLIDEGGFPSAPDSCSSGQWFGLVNGKFMGYGEPACEILEFDGALPDGASRLFTDPGSGVQYFHSREWVGNFNLIIPWRVNFDVGKILPWGWTVHNLAAHRPLCEVGVRAERQPQEPALTFIRLFAEPDAAFVPRHVVIKRDSKIEYLSAAASCTFGQFGIPQLVLSGGPNGPPELWLHVRVDGNEGWVKDDEDFEALGLPPAG